MIRRGTHPFLECSSRGDKRFSAFCARIRRRGNRSIEEIYQAAKVFGNGETGLHWRQAKGRSAINQNEVAVLYRTLWGEYFGEHPNLVAILEAASGLSDRFGQPGHVCQATVLWEIRARSLAQKPSR